MKYNLYLNAIFESIDSLSCDELSKIFAPDRALFSSCGVSFKIEESYRMSNYITRAIVKVHGIKNASLSDILSESGCNVESFISLLTDYIGIHIDGTQVLDGHKFDIEYTSFQL